MAEKDKTSTEPAAPVFSEADKARARQWFKKAADAREHREYDYAVECFITGLGYWPEAVEEGHMHLRSVALQRQQTGGKKPGLMDGLKKPISGKDHRQATLNAAHLLALDPPNAGYADALLRNANQAGLLETVKWAAPVVFDTLRRDKKPSRGRFKAYRDALVEAAQQAEARGNRTLQVWLLEQAVQALDYLVARNPADEALKSEQRDLAGMLTITRGKYEGAEDFRESLVDAEKQKMLHDADRVKQGEQSLATLIAAARKDWAQAPNEAAKINALVDLLLRAERKKEEDEAIRVLLAAYNSTQNYSFKQRADDIRLRHLARQTAALAAHAQQSGTEEDRQQARLATAEQRQVALEVYRERVGQYPTDLRLKFKLGSAFFDTGDYDEAIPMLQAAQAEPRSRWRCQLLIGRAFFEKGNFAQAAEVLDEALKGYELTDDTSKQLLYWLGRAHEAAGHQDEAKAAYGKLLRQDYNYMNGDARKRLENLK